MDMAQSERASELFTFYVNCLVAALLFFAPGGVDFVVLQQYRMLD
jgi:hypothetical protein